MLLQERGNAVSETIDVVQEAFKSCHEFMLPAPGRNIQECSADKGNAVTAGNFTIICNRLKFHDSIIISL